MSSMSLDGFVAAPGDEDGRGVLMDHRRRRPRVESENPDLGCQVDEGPTIPFIAEEAPDALAAALATFLTA
jgi:hypothetical protein